MKSKRTFPKEKKHPAREKKPSLTITGVIRVLAFFAVVLTLTLFAIRFPGMVTQAKGHSMEPFIASQDYVLTNRLAYLFSNPRRFDVILFSSPKDGETVSKRIIGLPGETVEIARGSILINGEILKLDGQLEECYRELGGYETKTVLGEGEYYVLGDSLSYSEDSRSSLIGAVKRDQIIGRVWLRYRPPFSFAGPVYKEVSEKERVSLPGTE